MEQRPKLTEPFDAATSSTPAEDGLPNLVVWTNTTMLEDVDPAGQLDDNVVRGVD